MPRLVLVNPRNDRTLYGEYGWQPLALGYVAALTPSHWEVALVDELVSPLTEDHLSADLVAITAFTTQAPRAYAIAADARARGTRTVIGGVHATFAPEEAARHADAVVLGEAESVWPKVLADFEEGALAPRYAGERVALRDDVVPRRELFAPGAYRYASMQSTRGCPLDCSFCSVTAFNGRTFRMSEPAWVADELARIPESRVLLVDDDWNGFSRKARDHALAVARTIAERDLGKRWMTQVTINFGAESELPEAAKAAGCAAVFIGFESLSSNDLVQIAKKRYTGAGKFHDAVKRIHDAGIAIVGSFILGIDGQDIDRAVDDTLAFIEEVELDAFNPTLLTPLPGTRDFARLAAEGRLLFSDYPNDWVHYNLATPTVKLPGVSEAKLFTRYLRWMSFFDPPALLARTERTRRNLGEAPAEAAYLWNRAWAAHYKRAGSLPAELPGGGGAQAR